MLANLLIAQPVTHIELQDLSSFNPSSPYSDRSKSPIVYKSDERISNFFKLIFQFF